MRRQDHAEKQIVTVPIIIAFYLMKSNGDSLQQRYCSLLEIITPSYIE